MQFNQLMPLLQRLDAAGLTLPAQARHAAAVLMEGGSVLHEDHPTLDGDMLTASTEELADLARRRAVWLTTRDHRGTIAAGVLDEVADALAAVLRDQADTLLNQMRPHFDKAAAAFHAAIELGLYGGIRPEQVIALDEPLAVNAWRSLREHADTLDRIAAIRILIADVLNLAPEPNPFGERQYATAFHTAALWKALQGRGGVDWWLNLSEGRREPLRLLTIAETRDLDVRTRRTSESAGLMASR